MSDAERYATIQARFNNPAFREAIGRLTFETFNWSDVFVSSVDECKLGSKVGQAVKLIATVHTIGDPFLYEKEGGSAQTLRAFSLIDRHGEEIECIPIEHTNPSPIAECFRNRSFQKFYGTIVPWKDKRIDRFDFLCLNQSYEVTAKERMAITEADIEPAQILLAQMEASGKSRLKFIKDILVEELGIRGLDKAVDLDKCIDFMIVQAFSDGKDSASLKLHSLVIGPPAVGKKLLTTIAKILNPVCVEVSGSKVTLAGVIGSVSTVKGRKVSNPGYLPQASHGTLCIQDFHDLDSTVKDKLSATFSKVMEDGIIIDSTMAKTDHEAETSIHLDLNLQSQVRPDGTHNVWKDLGIPVNVISRFDFIMKIPPDTDRQVQVALDILSKGGKLSTYAKPKEQREILRSLKCLVAYLRSRTTELELDADTNEKVRLALEFLLKDYRERHPNSKLIGDVATRMAISVQKYLKAITCMNERKHVVLDDRHLAFKFVQEKLKCLETLEEPQLLVGNKKSAGQSVRQKLILELFAGKSDSLKNIHAEVQKQLASPVAEKTLDRDLKAFEHQGLASHQHGQWKIK